MEQITKMGVLPKNVASQTTTQYLFKAHVGQGGSVQTTPANKQQLTDIERAEAKEYKKGMGDSPEDEAIRAQFEARPRSPEGTLGCLANNRVGHRLPTEERRRQVTSCQRRSADLILPSGSVASTVS